MDIDIGKRIVINENYGSEDFPITKTYIGATGVLFAGPDRLGYYDIELDLTGEVVLLDYTQMDKVED